MAKDYVIELPGGKSKRYTEDEFSSPNVQNFLQSDQQYKVYELQPLAPVENEDTKDDIFTLTLPNGNSKTYSNEDYHTPNVQRFVENNKDVKVERMRPYDYWGERAKTQQAELDEFDRTNGDFIAEYEARQSELDDDSLPEERRKKANEYVAENKRYYDELVNQLQTKQEAYENNPAVISKRNDYRNQTVEDLKKQKATNEAKWNELANQDLAAQYNPNDKYARRRLFLDRLALAVNPAAALASGQPGMMNVTSQLTGNAEDEANYKAANQLIDESIKLYGATKKKDFQGLPWYEKTAKAVASMAKGGADRVTEQEFWEELVDPVSSNYAIYKLHNKVTGLIGSYNDIQEADMVKVLDDNLTDSEQALLEAYLRNSQATNDNKDIHWSYKSGGSFTDSMKFMAEMMVGSGATGSAANGATKGMLKWFAKRAGTASTKLGRAAIKGTGKFAVGETRALVGGAIQTAVAPSTYAGVMERIATINDKGELDRTVEGALDGIFDRYIENASEFGLGLANKGLQAGKRQLVKAIGRRQWGSLYSGSVGRVMKAAGIQSGVEEWGEELNGAYIRALAGLMTGNKIGNTKEMGEFWSGENQLILLTSFAPTIGGGAALSAAQRKHLHNQQQSKKESLYNYLINTSGYTEDAAKAFVDAVGGDTPYDLAHNTSPYLRQFLKDNESDATGYKMILDYINTTAKALEVDSRNAIDQKVNREHEREAVTGSMQGHSGFTMKRELPNGSAYMNGVRRVQIDDKTGYIVSGDETEWGVNYEDGSVGYLSEKDIQDAVSNGNGADTGWMTEEDFLDLHAVENKKAAEEMRMGSEKAKQAEDLKSVLTPQAEIPWDQGTAIVNQILPDGYVIQTPDGQINQYSISQIAEHMGNPIDSKSDEELENDEVVNIEHREELKDKVDAIAKRGDAVPLERDGNKYHINAALGWEEKEDGTPVLHVYVTDEEGNNDSMMLETEEVAAYLGVNEAAWAAKGGDTMTMEQDKPKPASYTDDKGVLRDRNGKAIPIVMDENGQPILDEDGNPTVNEDAFIQESPEAWAAWNDERRQDGGANSVSLIGKLRAKAATELEEVQKSIEAETSPNRLNALEKKRQELAGHVKRFDDILSRYEQKAVSEKPVDPLRQRAAEWEKATGVKVNLLERVEDVPNRIARQKIEAQIEAEKQGKPADRVKGWYDPNTNEVYFYLPNIEDAKDLDETFIHEVVSHRGLRELLGGENYAVLCRRVWSQLMSEEQRRTFLGSVSHLNVSEDAKQLAAADEFIAYFAEQMQMNPTEEVKTTWQQFVKMLVDLLRKISGTNITEQDLSDLLVDSLTRYKLLNRQQAQESKKEDKQEPKQESALSKIPSFTDNDGETDYKWPEAPDVQTALLGMAEAGLDSDSIKEFAANRIGALAGEAKKIAAGKKKAISPKQMQKLNDALKENARETLFWQTVLDAINLAEATEVQGTQTETKTEMPVETEELQPQTQQEAAPVSPGQYNTMKAAELQTLAATSLDGWNADPALSKRLTKAECIQLLTLDQQYTALENEIMAREDGGTNEQHQQAAAVSAEINNYIQSLRQKYAPKKRINRQPTDFQVLRRAVEDVIDEMDFATQVRYALSQYKFLWEDAPHGKGLGNHIIASRNGASERDRRKYFAWIAGTDKGGMTPEMIAHNIFYNLPENLVEGHDTQEVLDIILDTVQSAKSPSELVRQVYNDIIDRYEQAEREEEERQKNEFARAYGFADYQDYVTFEELWHDGDIVNEVSESQIDDYYNAIYGTEADERAGEGQGVLEGSSGGVLEEVSGEEDTQRQNEGNIPGGNGQNEVYGRGNSLGQGEASDNGSARIRAGGSETRGDNVPAGAGTSGTAQNGVIQGLDGYTEQEIQDIVTNYINEFKDYLPEDFKVTGVRIVGSRTNGTANEDSDLDVLVEYEGSVREDDLFNALNGEDGLEIDGIKVDINPIRPDKSGTIDEWLERNKDYKKEQKKLTNDQVEAIAFVEGKTPAQVRTERRQATLEDVSESIAQGREKQGNTRYLTESVINDYLDIPAVQDYLRKFGNENTKPEDVLQQASGMAYVQYGMPLSILFAQAKDYDSARQKVEEIISGKQTPEVKAKEESKQTEQPVEADKEELARLDREYVEAVKSGDADKAFAMLREKALKTDGIIPYIAPAGYAGSHRDVARQIKEGEDGATGKAASDMARFVPGNAVLVPMPDHTGKVTDDTDTKMLAEAVSALTGSPVVAALEGNERESRHEAKQQRKRGPSAEELGFRQVEDIPEGMIPVFIDNVVNSGETAKAATQAIEGGFTLAYAKGLRSNPIKGLKDMTVTYDDNGSLIPLSQRFDKENPDIRFRFQGGGKTLFSEDSQLSLFSEKDMADRTPGNSLTTGGQTAQAERPLRSEPVVKPLRKLREGETCLVERRMTRSGNFLFTSGEKIETTADIAYIFRSLENKAVENAFLVFYGGEAEKAVVLHVGMGAMSESAVDTSVIVPMLDSIKPARVALVHNHPSGNLKASREDMRLLNAITGMVDSYSGGKVKVDDGIIIDTTSGMYGTFNTGKLEAVDAIPGRVKNEVPLSVYKFDENAFSKDYNPQRLERIRSSQDVAQFVATHRLGERSKINIICLNRNGGVVGNFFSDMTELSAESASDLARECARYCGACSASAVVVYGTGVGKPESSSLSENKTGQLTLDLRKYQIQFLDAVSLAADGRYDYMSYRDKGLLGEPGVNSGISSSKEFAESLRQAHGSAATSLRQVAAAFRKIDWQEGTTNLDLGGGRYDEATNYLKERGVENLVFDPYNRDSRSNARIARRVRDSRVNSVTCNNVLNVIDSEAARDNVILQAAKALAPGGAAYFSVYEGDKSGVGRETLKDSWQNNRTLASYVSEVENHFADVSIKNNMIIARNPIVDETQQSVWQLDATGMDDIRFREAIADEKTEDVFNRAIEEYGTTSSSRRAGYMLPDGRYLDFSEGQGYRVTDHRNVGIAYEGTADEGWKYMYDFMSRGAIRMKPEADGFELAVRPTPEQKRTLYRFIGERDGNVMVDILNPETDQIESAEYEDANPSMVLGEIDRFFNDGIIPQGNVMFREYKPRESMPKVRGGWTEKKILRWLKDNHANHGLNMSARMISEFDSPEQFKDHMFYHGTAYAPSDLKPSITMRDRDVERYGGGGYGHKYWGISLTKDKKTASLFSGTSSNVRIYPVVLSKNAKVVERPEWDDAYDAAEEIEQLWNDGVDAVWVGEGKQGKGEQELLVLNPHAISVIDHPDYYRQYQLGTANNPINIASDEDVENIYNTAKEYREALSNRPRFTEHKPSKFEYNVWRPVEKPNAYAAISDPEKYEQQQKAYEEYQKNLEAYDKAMEDYENKRNEFEQTPEYKAWQNVKNRANDTIRFRVANANQAIFVSNAQKAVENIKQEKATPDQWLAMIQSKGGLKAGEDKWMGLSQWLNDKKAEGVKTLTKQEVLGYIAANAIKIEETKYSENEELAGIDEIGDEITNDLVEVEAEYLTKYGKDGADTEFSDVDADDIVRYISKEMEKKHHGFNDIYTVSFDEELGTQIKYKIQLNKTDIHPTRLNYSSIGLDNKREIALTVPTIEPYNTQDVVHFGDAGGGRAIGWIRFGETYDRTQRIPIDRHVDEFEEPVETINKRQSYYPKGGNSYNTKEYVVYGRIRTGEDKYVLMVNDGNKQIGPFDTLEDARKALNEWYDNNPKTKAISHKILVIDEIQSKRHQEGKRKGYKSAQKKGFDIDNVKIGEYQREKYTTQDIYTAPIYDSDGNKIGDISRRTADYDGSTLYAAHIGDFGNAGWYGQEQWALNDIARQQEYRYEAVPDAPFEKNWPELCMKRMLRLAAEEGYDKMAWTDGETQAERYSLSSAIDHIAYTVLPDDKIDARAYLPDGNYQPIGNTWEEVAQYVGKDMARRMQEGESNGTENIEWGIGRDNEPIRYDYKVVKGDGLKIGGEGMKGFYDRMLPAFMTKYGKQWGVKPELQEIGDLGGKWWTIDITPEMKADVMEGQVMFRIGDNERTHELNAKQKQPGEDHVILDNEIIDDIRFRLSKNNRKVVESWLNKRTDIDAAERESTLAYIDNLADAKTQLATGWWFAKGTIRLPEDMPKVEQAVAISSIAKVDPLKYSSPMELINAHADIQAKEKPINPDEVSTLHKAQELPEGIVVYDVDDTEESRKNMRAIIDTHFGKESSPWCLLQGDGEGNLTRQSREYWEYYNAYPKQVAFKDGKLQAFSANNEEKRIWWDRMDQSHKGIPVEGKIPGDKLGRSAVMEYNPIDGEMNITGDTWKGNRENGPFEIYYGTSEQLRSRSTRKNGVDVGKKERWYENGKKQAEFYNDENGHPDGPFTTWYDNGQVLKRGTRSHGVNWRGLYESFYENGQLENRTVFSDKANGNIIEPAVSYYINGQMKLFEPYDKDGHENGTETGWYSDGTKKHEVDYVNGVAKRNFRWFPNGDMDVARYWDENGDATGTWEEYEWNWDDKKSVLVERTHYNKGFRDGLYEEFYDNGNPKQRNTYVEGKAEGLAETWNSEGKPLLRWFVQQPGSKEIGHEYYKYEKNEVVQLYTCYDSLDTPHNYTKTFPMEGYKPLTAEELATYPEWVKERAMEEDGINIRFRMNTPTVGDFDAKTEEPLQYAGRVTDSLNGLYRTIAPVHAISRDITAEELAQITGLEWETAERLHRKIGARPQNEMGFYDGSDTRRIFVFDSVRNGDGKSIVPTVADMENTYIHENLHAFFDRYRNESEENSYRLFDYLSEIRNIAEDYLKAKLRGRYEAFIKEIQEHYGKGSDYAEEMSVRYLTDILFNEDAKAVEDADGRSEKKILSKFLSDFGYVATGNRGRETGKASETVDASGRLQGQLRREGTGEADESSDGGDAAPLSRIKDRWKAIGDKLGVPVEVVNEPLDATVSTYEGGTLKVNIGALNGQSELSAALMAMSEKMSLSEILGDEAVREFAQECYRNLPEFRQKVVEIAQEQYGWNTARAMMQYLGSMAESETADDETIKTWSVIRTAFDNMLDRVFADKALMGIQLFGMNQLRYILFKNAHQGDSSIEVIARGARLAHAQGVSTADREIRADGAQAARVQQAQERTGESAANLYNRVVSRMWARMDETYRDQFQSVNTLVDALEKASKKLAQEFEDIRKALNQQSSKGLAAMQKWEREHWNKMMKAVQAIIDERGLSYDEVERYLMLKHGVERNDVFAKRDARAYYQTIHDTKVASIREYAKQHPDVSDEEIQRRIDREDEKLDRHFTAIKSGTDGKYKELREKDYGGLTGLYSNYENINPYVPTTETQEEYEKRLLAARKPMFDNISDMELAADAEIADFEKRMGSDLTTELWKQINGATKAVLKHQYDANMMSRGQYEHVRDMFKYYVPLRGFAETTPEDMYSYYTSNADATFVVPLKQAKGRKTKAESPLAYIGAMASSAIAADIKNESKLALYYFVSNRQKDNDLVLVSDVWYVKQVDADGNALLDEQGRTIFEPQYPPFTEALSTDQAKAEYEQWENEMKQLAREHRAFRGVREIEKQRLNYVINTTKQQAKSHIIAFKLGGRDMFMFINGNPRAAQAINGELNVDASKNEFTKATLKFLRAFAALNTSLNPEFWLSNLQRDTLFALMAVSVKEDKAYNEAFRKNLRQAMKVVRMKRDLQNGKLGTGELEQHYRLFVENGGVTGYTSVRGTDVWEAEIKKYTGETRTAIERAGAALDAVQEFGESFEQMTRFAAYLTSRQQGKSVVESVADAKELTVNFNRKGSGKGITWKESEFLRTREGRKLNDIERLFAVSASMLSVYGRHAIMFFNASVQGLNAMYLLAKKDKSKLGLWVGGYLMLGVMNAVLHAMLDGDDDDDDQYLDVPDYERRNNLLLGLKGVYLKWALPQEARVFYGMGDMVVNHSLGREPHRNIVGEVASMIGEIAPLDATSGLAAVLPSITTPVVEVIQNEDYKGARVYNENRFLSDEEKKHIPAYRNPLKNTSKVYVALSEALNWISGGNEYEAGAVNWNPNIIEHIVEGYTGGVGTTVGKGLKFMENALGGEVKISDTPFLRRLMTWNDDRYRNAHVTDLYYYYREVAQDTERRLKEAMKAGDEKYYKKVAGSYDYKVLEVWKRYEKEMDGYDKYLRQLDGKDRKQRKQITREHDALRARMIRDISDLK